MKESTFRKPLAARLLNIVSKGIIVLIGLLVIVEVVVDFGRYVTATDSSDQITSLATHPLYVDKPWAVDYFRELDEALVNEWGPYNMDRIKFYEGKYINVDCTGPRTTFAGEDNGQTPLVVWVYGGSAVWGVGARDDHTIPSELARQLAVKLAQPVKVINFGQPEYVSTQQLFALHQAVQYGQKPDMLIIYDGAHDVVASAISGPGKTMKEWQRHQEFNFRSDENQWLRIKSVLKETGLYFVLSPVRNWAFSLTPYQPKTARDYESDGLQGWSRATALVYKNNFLEATRVGQAHDFPVYGFFQPTLFTKKTIGEKEKASMVGEVWGDGGFLETWLDEMRASMAGTPHYYDLSDAMGGGSYFFDPVNMTEEGNATVAARMADMIAADYSTNGPLQSFYSLGE